MAMNPEDMQAMMEQMMGGQQGQPQEQMPTPEGLPPLQMTPEELAMMEQGGMPEGAEMPEEMPQEGMPEEMMGGMPPEMQGMPEGMMGMEDDMMGMGMDMFEDEMMPEPPNPVEALSESVMNYLDFVEEVRNDAHLGIPQKAQTMLQIAQALNYLVPLLNESKQTDPQKGFEMQLKEAEFEMRREEQEHSFQMKQQEFEMQMQFKQQELQFKQQEMEMKLQAAQQQNQLKIEAEQHKLVQSEQQHQVKMEQQKQAAQLKPTSKQGSDQ